MFKQGADSFRDKRLFEISEVEITRVNCIALFLQSASSENMRMAISRSQLIYSKYLETLTNYHTYPIKGPVKMFKMCLKLLSTVVQNLTKLLANVTLKFQS